MPGGEHMADLTAMHASAGTRMATVLDLFVYPLKSARGIPSSRVRVTATGLEWDRHWMIVNATGTFLTQRTHPQLARIVTEIADSSLTLTAPGQSTLRVPLAPFGEEVPVRVWDHACTALDQGKEAGEWVSEAIGQAARLVRVAPFMGRVANPKYAGMTPAPVAFPDGFPLLV